MEIDQDESEEEAADGAELVRPCTTSTSLSKEKTRLAAGFSWGLIYQQCKRTKKRAYAIFHAKLQK